tara:strand:+ start:62 stop:1504 length:1443 start_codon:yes stop_codon:yes gene_type:complete
MNYNSKKSIKNPYHGQVGASDFIREAEKYGSNPPNNRKTRRALNSQQQISPMVSIKHDYVENNTNKRTGDFRLLDGQSGRVSPELIKFFNGSEIQKQQEETIKKEEKHMLSYLKGWQSPYGYAAWPWVFHWMTRLRQDGFTQESIENVTNRISSKKRENCLEEAHLLGDEMMINRAEPIYLTKEILDDFYRTDIPSFDAVQNEILPSFVIMLPKNQISIIDYDHRNNHSITRNTRAILVVTNNCYRKRLRKYYNDFLELYSEEQRDIYEGRTAHKGEILIDNMRKRLDERLDPINYIDDERDGYMFESGFKILALDDKCGAVFADFNWKDGTKNFKVFESEDEIQTREAYKKDKNKKGNLDQNCQISDTYAGLINIVANTILTMSHHTEYVSVKSPMMPRATGFNQVGQEIPPQPATWIGEGYNSEKPKYEYPDDHVPSKGTSPRPHWRRGHQRYVCQGPGRKQKVLKWIKPCYVNGTKD